MLADADALDVFTALLGAAVVVVSLLAAHGIARDGESGGSES